MSTLQTKLAIRSGGHSPNPGRSSINDTGLLIDLQKLNHITVSADKNIASLRPGGRLAMFLRPWTFMT